MRKSLRYRLLVTFFVAVVLGGTATLFGIERTLAGDLVTGLDTRLAKQGQAVAAWLAKEGNPAQLAQELAEVTGTRITIVGADGLITGDSAERDALGKPIGDAEEIAQARTGATGRAHRSLSPDEPPQYLLAVRAAAGSVIRLAVPMGDITDARSRMRARLLVGFGVGFVGSLLLSWVFVRAITRPIRSVTQTAERLAAGQFDAPPPTAAIAAGGDFGVLARAMMQMAGEIKARIAELTEQRDLQSVVVGALVEGVIVVAPGGALTLVNEAAQPLVGEGKLPEPLAKLVARAEKGEQADDELELVGRTVRAAARPLQAGAVIVVLYDVTALRAAEAVRQGFLSNAAHELRTPVTSISGYAETLLGAGVDSDTSREFLQTIHRNAQRIAGLVSDLLVLEQLGGREAVVGDRVAVALVEVVQDAVRTAKGVTPSAQISVDVADGLDVLGTRDGLDHVVQNLVDNAVKYGGDSPVVVSAGRDGKKIRLAISDGGPGIPRGHEERVFERFYRLDAGRSRDRGGSGLGLAIVRSQVEAMGGRVWVEDAKPGARFVVELDPFDPAAASKRMSASKIRPGTPIP